MLCLPQLVLNGLPIIYEFLNTLLQCALRRLLLHKVDNNVISHKFSGTDLVFKLLPGPGDWLRIGRGVVADVC